MKDELNKKEGKKYKPKDIADEFDDLILCCGNCSNPIIARSIINKPKYCYFCKEEIDWEVQDGNR